MNNSEDNWVTFHFESNQAFGTCETKEQWVALKNKYLEYHDKHGGLDLNRALMNCHITQDDIDNGTRIHDFGFRGEHTGDYSLAQFGIDNNMKL